MEAEWLSVMRQTVGIEPYLAQDAYGRASYGAQASYRCYVDGRVRMLRSDRGEEVLSVAQVYLYGAPAISTRDRVTMPDGTHPPIHAVKKLYDERGVYSLVLYVGAS